MKGGLSASAARRELAEPIPRHKYSPLAGGLGPSTAEGTYKMSHNPHLKVNPLTAISEGPTVRETDAANIQQVAEVCILDPEAAKRCVRCCLCLCVCVCVCVYARATPCDDIARVMAGCSLKITGTLKRLLRVTFQKPERLQ